MSGNPFDFNSGGEPAKKATDDERDDEPKSIRKRDRSVGFRCPYCNSRHPPEIISKTSTAGWITFWVLFCIGCWPFFLFALLMTENVAYCEDCGMKLTNMID